MTYLTAVIVIIFVSSRVLSPSAIIFTCQNWKGQYRIHCKTVVGCSLSPGELSSNTNLFECSAIDGSIVYKKYSECIELARQKANMRFLALLPVSVTFCSAKCSNWLPLNIVRPERKELLLPQGRHSGLKQR